MDRGFSWSGNERNCVYLNRGDGQFVDVSSLSGLDFDDDGRGVVACDWDGDGDLDLWLRSRSGPTLRFMENMSPASDRTISIRLQGVAGNRDAIGSRVSVVSSKSVVMRTVVAGSGYLSQSTKEIILVCPGDEEAVEVQVAWPGGRVQRVQGVSVGSRLIWEEGKAPAIVNAGVRHLKRGEAGAISSNLRRGGELVFLRTPLVAPPSVLTTFFGGRFPKRPTFLAIWAEWCVKCRAEITEFAEADAQLSAAGLDVLLLNADDVKKRRSALEFLKTLPGVVEGRGALKHRFLPTKQMETLSAVARHVVGSQVSIPLPFGLLIDTRGRIQIMTVGKVGADTLMRAHGRVQRLPTQPAHRSMGGGRYYFQMPRDWLGLASLLDGVDAVFYRRIDEMRRRRPRR